MIKNTPFSCFLLIWTGDFISTIGSGLAAFALGVYAFDSTGLATSTAMVMLCSFLPAFLLRPLGGVLADRFNRTFLMLAGNIGSAIGIGVTFLLLDKSASNFVFIYPGIILSSIFFACQNPAYKASVSDFLPEELYSKASGLLQLSNAGQFLIAPFLAGILMSMFSIKIVLLIDAFTFLFSAALVLLVILRFNIPKKKPAEVNKFSIKEDISVGLKVIFKSKGIVFLISIVALLLFYVGLLQTLLPPMVLSFSTASVLGISQSVCALGMLAASGFISVVQRKQSNRRILSISLFFMGVSFSFIGIVQNIWSVIIPGIIFFSVIPFVNSSVDVLIRKNIGNEAQGRAWSLISVFTYLGAVIAYASAGFLADRVFNPLFLPGGILEESFGKVFGVGVGRGIAFMFFLSGILVSFLSVVVYKSRRIVELEEISFFRGSVDVEQKR